MIWVLLKNFLKSEGLKQASIPISGYVNIFFSKAFSNSFSNIFNRGLQKLFNLFAVFPLPFYTYLTSKIE